MNTLNMNNINEENLDSKTVVQLIDFLILNHHEYMKAELPRVTKLAYTIRRVHGNTHPELHEVEKTFKDIVEKIEQYIEKEENRIFPNIKEYIKLNIEGNLEVMEVEANDLKNKQISIIESFKKLREQTNNNVAPDDGCQTFDLTYELFSEIEEVLNKQFNIENKYLFPKLM